jgi:uncharacterized membrane-anchored protein YjiN (DUF445 family)
VGLDVLCRVSSGVEGHGYSSFAKVDPMIRIRHVLLVGALALAFPSFLTAQQRMPASQASPAEQQEVQQLLTELRQLNTKLESIRQTVMADPQLQTTQEALGEEIKTAMEKADPELPRSLKRAEALEAEAAKAQREADEAKLQKLAEEAQQIQMRFVEAQAKVLNQPEVAAKVEAFQDTVEARMAQVDPEAPALIKRFQDLETRLTAYLSTAAAPR